MEFFRTGCRVHLRQVKKARSMKRMMRPSGVALAVIMATATCLAGCTPFPGDSTSAPPAPTTPPAPATPDPTTPPTTTTPATSAAPDPTHISQGSSPGTQTLDVEPSLRPVDGKGKLNFPYSSALQQESYFPIAIWHASVLDEGQIQKDRAVGVNTYLELTPDSDMALIRRAGIPAMASFVSQHSPGFVLPDEVDMWGRAGDGEWSGNSPGEGEICVPSTANCGFTVLKKFISKIPNHLVLYANFGKGVTFWENDKNASKFVNNYADIISADNYWFTDPNICSSSEGGQLLPEPAPLASADCRLAANYGWTVERLRSLVEPAGSKPVWAFVEVGRPFSDAESRSITIPQIRGAVWSSLIHGARGIVYFNHSFSGDCASQNVLRDCGEVLRSGLKEINREVAKVAPILNSPHLDNAIESEGRISAAVKAYRGDVYILVAPDRPGKQLFRINLPCTSIGNATVMGEDRSVNMNDGYIRDQFSGEEAFKIYQLEGTGCIPDS